MDLHRDREHYDLKSIDFGNIPSSPWEMFEQWFLGAKNDSRVLEANAVTLVTVDSNNQPSSRVVLLKAFSEQQGMVFYTNYASEKGRAIACNSQVAMSFFWPSLQQQIHIQGKAKKITDKASSDYFMQRPRGSQLGAVLSQQSQQIPLEFDMDKAADDLRNKFEGEEVPRPSTWGGFAITPSRFEFWQGRPSRLHDRLLYALCNNEWAVSRRWP